MELPELPQPRAHFSATEHGDYLRSTPADGVGKWEGLHDDAAMRAYGIACAQAALEAAAKVCDAMNEAEDWYALTECAAAIRAIQVQP